MIFKGISTRKEEEGAWGLEGHREPGSQPASLDLPHLAPPPYLPHLVAVGLVLLDEPETIHQHGVIKGPGISSK